MDHGVGEIYSVHPTSQFPGLDSLVFDNHVRTLQERLLSLGQSHGFKQMVITKHSHNAVPGPQEIPKPTDAKVLDTKSVSVHDIRSPLQSLDD